MIDINYSGTDTVDINDNHTLNGIALDHNFSYTATVGDITVPNGGVATTGTGTVSLNAVAGAIKGLEATDATANVTTAVGGSVTLEANTGISDSGTDGFDIDSNGGAVNLTRDGAGLVNVDYSSTDADAVTLTVTDNGTGNLEYASSATGALTAGCDHATGWYLDGIQWGADQRDRQINTTGGINDDLSLTATAGQ